MVEPVVWVPIAIGTMKSATAAAEPLDEPAGVRARSCGLRVGPGCRLANSVVTVLPSSDAAGLAGQRDAGGVASGLAAFVDRRAPFGRQVEGVDDVLDAERHAGERSALRVAVGRARGGQRRLGVEMGPGMHLAVAGGDAVEAGPHHRFARGLARGRGGDDLGRGQFVERFDGWPLARAGRIEPHSRPTAHRRESHAQEADQLRQNLASRTAIFRRPP